MSRHFGNVWFFRMGGRGAVVAQFLLDPPTHKKSETGNRRTLDTLRWSLAVNARHLTLAVKADA